MLALRMLLMLAGALMLRGRAANPIMKQETENGQESTSAQKNGQ